MRYEITHTTTYEYSDPVSVSYHVLRLHPRAHAGQRCLRNELHIDPRPVVAQTHSDYFGNVVTFVTVEGAHRKWVVTSRSELEVEAVPAPAPESTTGWEEARDRARGDEGALESGDFLFPSPLIKAPSLFAAYAAPSFPAGRPLLEAVLDLTRRIHREFKFDSKATTVTTPVEQMLNNRRGVCQDFAHLEIACLRSMGIPARYVSGYLETDPPPGKPRLVGADASHAWVSFYCPGNGWVDVDPTNNLIPSTRHLTVAWGRDYGDVSPVRGVILGSGEHSLKVSVDVLPVPSSIPGFSDKA